MRVAQVERFGGPEVLVTREVPDPVAEAGQVVVEVVAADTLFVETRIRQGMARAFFPVEPPYVPGGAVAGRVRSAGARVDPGWVGREVAAFTEGGGYAEQAVVPVEALVPVVAGLAAADAVALMHDGVTALGVFDAAEVKPGEWVLVTAAAGGMGVLLVQLAHAAGARVVAAARGGSKLDLARRLGAGTVVDYTGPGWAEHVRVATGGAGPDVVFDGAGGEIGRAAFQITADGGRFSAHGAAAGGFAPVDPDAAARRRVTVRGIQDVQYALAERTTLAGRALAEAAAGRIRPVVGRTYPLDRAADAHTAIESRAVAGKTLLLM
ncbi:zinc-binding dehydrogenase [Sphaerisporangium aureirubrum]|uniref:Zinc-binding dehydrogenase n=1 Tax=Sphaerisporangium aureirubrum TaxID=1544736 RepID=A0ABW1NFE5_9ACTN